MWGLLVQEQSIRCYYSPSSAEAKSPCSIFQNNSILVFVVCVTFHLLLPSLVIRPCLLWIPPSRLLFMALTILVSIHKFTLNMHYGLTFWLSSWSPLLIHNISFGITSLEFNYISDLLGAIPEGFFLFVCFWQTLFLTPCQMPS